MQYPKIGEQHKTIKKDEYHFIWQAQDSYIYMEKQIDTGIWKM
jgi:hypothetical protein